MDPLRETPTDSVDYAVLSAGFAAVAGAVALANRRSSEPLRERDAIPLGVASFALAKLVTKEKVQTWIREPFVDELPGGGRRPKGRRLRYAIGELLSCTRCVGAWSALSLAGIRALRPQEAHVILVVLSASAVNDFAQAAFARLCATANAAEQASRELSADSAERRSGENAGLGLVPIVGTRPSQRELPSS